MFSKPNKAFGLDISDNSLRLIQLKKSRKGTIVNAWAEVPLKPGWLVNGEVKNAKSLVATIKKFCHKPKNGKLLSREVIACLPETKTFIKLVTISPASREEIPGLLAKQIPEHIPVDPKKIYFDWQIINDRGREMDVLIGVAPKKQVEDYTNILLEAGLFPQALEIEAVAISRAINHVKKNGMQAVLDFGGNRSSLIVRNAKTILFSVSIPFSGASINKVISEKLKLDAQKSEDLKMKCGLDPQKCPENLYSLLDENLKQLTTKIKSSLKFYEDHFPAAQPITKLIICGGGANLASLSEYLKKNLGVEIEKIDPLTKFKLGKKAKPFPQGKSMSFVTALGLAMRTHPPQPVVRKPVKPVKSVKSVSPVKSVKSVNSASSVELATPTPKTTPTTLKPKMPPKAQPASKKTAPALQAKSVKSVKSVKPVESVKSVKSVNSASSVKSDKISLPRRSSEVTKSEGGREPARTASQSDAGGSASTKTKQC